MLKFIDAPMPADTCFPSSGFQLIELNGTVVGEMYCHKEYNGERFHACIRLLPGGDALAQGHGRTRTAAVMEALQVYRDRSREIRDRLVVITAEIADVIVMEPEPAPLVTVPDSECPPF